MSNELSAAAVTGRVNCRLSSSENVMLVVKDIGRRLLNVTQQLNSYGSSSPSAPQQGLISVKYRKFQKQENNINIPFYLQSLGLNYLEMYMAM